MFEPYIDISEKTRETLRQVTRLTGAQKREAESLSMDDILRQHAQLGGEGILRRQGANPHWVPVLLEALINWFNTSPAHVIIRAAVLYVELVKIQPFATLSEEVAHTLHRKVISDSYPAAAQTAWGKPQNATTPDEMLESTLRILDTALHKATPHNRHQKKQMDKILAYLQRHPGSNRADILAAHPGLSSRMLDRHLQSLRENGAIEHRGSRKTGAYYAL